MTAFFISGFISQIADPYAIKSYKKEIRESDIQYALYAYPFSIADHLRSGSDMTKLWLLDRFDAKSQIDFYRFDQNRFSTILYAVWGISMIDAFFSVRDIRQRFRKKKNLSHSDRKSIQRE